MALLLLHLIEEALAADLLGKSLNLELLALPRVVVEQVAVADIFLNMEVAALGYLEDQVIIMQVH